MWGKAWVALRDIIRCPDFQQRHKTGVFYDHKHIISTEEMLCFCEVFIIFWIRAQSVLQLSPCPFNKAKWKSYVQIINCILQLRIYQLLQLPVCSLSLKRLTDELFHWTETELQKRNYENWIWTLRTQCGNSLKERTAFPPRFRVVSDHLKYSQSVSRRMEICSKLTNSLSNYAGNFFKHLFNSLI